MTVEQYFTMLGYDHHTCKHYFFVQCKHVGETFHGEFWTRTTPIRTVGDWWGCDEIMDSFILNTRAFSNDWIGGARWDDNVLAGGLNSLLIVTKEELLKHYTEKQAESTIAWRDKHIEEEIGKMEIHKPVRDKSQPERIHMRENARLLRLACKYLTEDGTVDIWNAYETFYGVGFDRWLRESLKDRDCDIKVLDYDTYNDYPRGYRISLNREVVCPTD